MATDSRDTLIQTPEEIQQELNRIQYKRALSRRSFMQSAAIAGAGLASVALISGCGTSGDIERLERLKVGRAEPCDRRAG